MRISAVNAMNLRKIEVSVKEASENAKREKSIQEFLDTKDKYYIYIKGFFAVPLKYKIIGCWAAYQEVPRIEIEFENGVIDERTINELMSCYILEDCKRQCEKLNDEMEQHRNMWQIDKWRLKEVVGV